MVSRNSQNTVDQIVRRSYVTKRFDGAVDMVVEFTLMSGDTRFMAVRDSTDKLVGVHEAPPLAGAAKARKSKRFTPPSPSKEASASCFVPVARKRTFKSTLNSLLAMKSDLAHCTEVEANRDFFRLNADHFEHVRAQARLKRQWRVHEYAEFGDTGWIARLSCDTGGDRCANTQFVLVAPQYMTDSAYTEIEYSRTALAAPRRDIKRALLASHLHQKLGQLLADAKDGFATAREAKILYGLRIERMGVPTFVKVFDKGNSVRQAGHDLETRIRVAESYEGHRYSAYLLDTSRGWFVLSVHGTFHSNSMEGGRASLVGQHPSTPFDTPVKTARVLLKRASGITGVSENVARQQLEEKVAEDFAGRCAASAFSSKLLITHVAQLPGDEWAVKAVMLPESTPLLPVGTSIPAWHILVSNRQSSTDDSRVADLVHSLPDNVAMNYGERDKGCFFREAAQAIVRSNDKGAREHIERMVRLAFYSLSKGFRSGDLAAEAWRALTQNGEVTMVDPEAWPVPSRLLHARMLEIVARERAQLKRNIDDGYLTSDEINQYDKRLALLMNHPPLLVDYLKRQGLTGR